MALHSPIISEFLLDPNITFLNFGSFGACPKPIFEQYQAIQRELEYSPVQFMLHKGPKYLEQSREALGKLINCNAQDVVLVSNPSYAVNIVAKSFNLQSGNEILTTNLEYGACDRTWQFYCDKANANYVQIPITLPIIDEQYIVDAFAQAISTRTKLIFISHITSSTALRMPVEQLTLLAHSHGIPIFIDGAHAIGQLPLDMQALNADYYTAACHKWLMTPKGCSMLYCKPQYQATLDPLVVSWGYNAIVPSNSQFLDYHEQQGTRDYSANCTLTFAINYFEQNNIFNYYKACAQFVYAQAPRFAQLLGTTPLAPLHTRYINQMLALQINTPNAMALKNTLYLQHHIEMPITQLGANNYIRFSVAACNTPADYNVLYKALEELIAEGKYLVVK
jgi:isopenicillin-N epimerase